MMQAPKDPRENYEYRREIIQRAAVDKDFREACRYWASQDLIWYIDTFGWTYGPKDNADCPDQPFITYPFQERALLQMDAALGRYPLLGEKSRDMGFTWMIVALAAWRFHFRSKQSFLFGSRKQEYVDKSGDPKSLFWKIDYFFQQQPGWLVPYMDRTILHIANLENGSTIDGESTNDNFARGDRRTAIFLDEFPAVDNSQQIAKSAGDASNCVIYFGTPMGTAGAFYEIRAKMIEEMPDRIIRLHWTEHPEKKRGLYTSVKDSDGIMQLKTLDSTFRYPQDYKFKLDGQVRSWAYDERERRAPNRRVMAQEWNIDYLASAWQLFDPIKLAEIKAKWARAPVKRGDVLFDPDWKHPRFMENERGGNLQIWFSPDSEGNVPRNWRDIVIGCDIGLGTQGEFSSNSVASIVRRSTGEKLAQFTSNDLSPTEFCRRVLALCTWFNGAYLIWESNGPGGLFTSEVKKSGYRNVYYSEANLQNFIDKKSEKPGWHSSKDGKKILLEDYSNALVEGTFKNYCAEAIDEAGQYIHEPNGVIIHAKAKAQRKDDTDPTEAGENHGDICFVAGTMIHTPAGERAIETLRCGDFVTTRKGSRRVVVCGLTSEAATVWVVRLSNGRTLTGTGNHPVWTNERGWVGLSSLTQLDTLVSCPENTQLNPAQRQLCSMEFGSTVVPIRDTCICHGITGRTAVTKLLELAHCMSRFGSFITERFRLGVSFITWMAIHSITTLKTWFASRKQSISGCMTLAAILPVLGIRFSISTSAFVAENSTKHFGSSRPSIAPKPAKRPISEQISCTTKIGNVASAEKPLLPINARSLVPAQRRAGGVCILNVMATPGQQRVYNLSVEGEHEYFAEGVLVHNCIADALANFGIVDLLKREIDKPATQPAPPPGSFGARSLEARRATENKPRRWGQFKTKVHATDGCRL